MNSTIFWELINIFILIGAILLIVNIALRARKLVNTINKIEKDIKQIKEKINRK